MSQRSVVPKEDLYFESQTLILATINTLFFNNLKFNYNEARICPFLLGYHFGFHYHAFATKGTLSVGLWGFCVYIVFHYYYFSKKQHGFLFIINFSPVFFLSLCLSHTLNKKNCTQAPIQLNLLAQEHIDELFEKGEECMGSECDVESVSNLLEHLKFQEKELTDRVAEIDKMVSALEAINKDSNREVDEVRETVRAIFRIFQMGDKASGNDYPALSKPTGYSGEVGDGPTTAYDALPPKKYKA